MYSIKRSRKFIKNAKKSHATLQSQKFHQALLHRLITRVLLEMYVLTLMIKKVKDTIYIVMKTSHISILTTDVQLFQLNEEAYKWVKARPKKNQINYNPEEKNLPVFGRWQTEDYIPPPAVDISAAILK